MIMNPDILSLIISHLEFEAILYLYQLSHDFYKLLQSNHDEILRRYLSRYKFNISNYSHNQIISFGFIISESHCSHIRTECFTFVNQTCGLRLFGYLENCCPFGTNSNNDTNWNTPVLLPKIPSIKQIIICSEFTLILTENGTSYITLIGNFIKHKIRSNNYIINSTLVEDQTFLLTNITDINHMSRNYMSSDRYDPGVLLTTKSGDVLYASWEHWILKPPNTQFEPQLYLISDLHNITQTACSQHYLFALSDNGLVYIFENFKSRIFHDVKISLLEIIDNKVHSCISNFSDLPTNMKRFDNIVQIEACGYVCMFLNSEGQVGIYGYSEYTHKIVMLNITNSTDIIRISCEYFDNFAILTTNGKVRFFSWDSRLGHDPSGSGRIYEYKVNLSHIIDISAGLASVIMLDNKGNVYGLISDGFTEYCDDNKDYYINDKYPKQFASILISQYILASND